MNSRSLRFGQAYDDTMARTLLKAGTYGYFSKTFDRGVWVPCRGDREDEFYACIFPSADKIAT